MKSSPARVPQLNITGGAQLGPVKKLLAIAAASRELVEASDAESAIKILLRESAAFSLDVSVFSAIAGSSARPAGLLSGVSALTPAAATAGKDAAMDDDLAALAGAVGAVAAGLAFVMHPQQANAVRTRRGTQWDPTIPIWPTIGVAAGNVIALDPAGVASAFGPEAEVRASREAAIVFDDSAPGAINVAGSSPAGSIFQTDSIVLQLRLRAAWCLRIPGAVAWMSGVNW